MVYSISYKRSVAKDLRKLDKKQLKMVVSRIQSLVNDPQSSGCIRMQGGEGLYRIRQGDYRIVYRIEDGRLVILILKIGHRKGVYGVN